METLAYVVGVAFTVLFLIPFFAGWLLAVGAMVSAPVAGMASVFALWLKEWRPIYVYGVFRGRRPMERAVAAMKAEGIEPGDIATFEEEGTAQMKNVCRYPRSSRFLVSLHLQHGGESCWAKSILFGAGARLVGTAPEEHRRHHGIRFERSRRAA